MRKKGLGRVVWHSLAWHSGYKQMSHHRPWEQGVYMYTLTCPPLAGRLYAVGPLACDHSELADNS